MATTGFGSWLRQERSRGGLSQDALALHLSISTALLRKLESGERRPSVQVAAATAHRFNIPPEEHAAFVAFARGDSGAADASTDTPWRELFQSKSNVPIGPTPLLGREHEINTLTDLLLQNRTRLITLTGVGGVGKTRLAAEVALRLVKHFSDGCTFVDLAATLDPDLVLSVIAHALGLKEDQGRPLGDVLREYVRSRRMLLVLDNFEQVLDAGVGVARLQQTSPWLKVLVTSREALRVRSERRFVVGPLGVPDHAAATTPERALESAAVAVFFQRAQDVDPRFALTDDNVADVVAVCAQLQGVPLAIELAAARVRRGSVADIHSGLGDALSLLTAGARDLPVRQQTLRASIQWSYDLLTPDEQQLFRFLGTFVGGAVDTDLVAAAPAATSSTSTVNLLEALTEKSLVIADPTNLGNELARSVRYRLLETVREFAHAEAVRLVEVKDFRARHAARYLALALDADDHFTGPLSPDWGPRQIQWTRRLQADLANVRSALEWYLSLASRDGGGGANASAHAGLKLARAMRRVWLVGGYFSEGLGWLRAFVELTAQGIDHAPDDLRLDYAEALAVIGRLAPHYGEGRTAYALLDESLRIAADLHQTRLTAYVLLIRGLVAFSDGAYSDAQGLYTRCLELYRSLGNSWGCAAALEELGRLALDQGDADRAEALLHESRMLFLAVGDPFGSSSVTESMGRLAYARGDFSEARRIWLEVLTSRRDIGYTSGLGRVLAALGWAAIHLRDPATAKSTMTEALQIAWTLGTVQVIHDCLVGFGALAASSGQITLAARRFAAAEAYHQDTKLFVPPVRWTEINEQVTSARARTAVPVWDEAWQVGRATPTETVVREILDDVSVRHLTRSHHAH